MSRRRSGSTAVLVGILAAFSLTGCFFQTKVRTDGATGVTVDSAGRPVLAVAVCRGQMENVLLFTPASSQPVGEWQRERVSATSVEVPVLTDPGAQWTVSAAPTRVSAGVVYTALAQSSDKKWQMTPVDFTAAALRSVDPQTVRYSRGRTPRATFYDVVCRGK